MQILPLSTGILSNGDDLVSALMQHFVFEDGDILALSSKAVATVEGAHIHLSTLTTSQEAQEWNDRLQFNQPEGFRQAVLEETTRLQGSIVGSCPHAMLAELRPKGMVEGSLLAANAGLDLSNTVEGTAIGWPQDPIASIQSIRSTLEQKTGKSIAILLTDSCCRPRRIGVTAIALVVSGFDPLQSEIGKKDLFGHELRMTNEARADQLATAANFVMGNADQCIPAAVIRDHGLIFSDFEGWVPGIDPEDDLFKGAL